MFYLVSSTTLLRDCIPSRLLLFKQFAIIFIHFAFRLFDIVQIYHFWYRFGFLMLFWYFHVITWHAILRKISRNFSFTFGFYVECFFKLEWVIDRFFGFCSKRRFIRAAPFRLHVFICVAPFLLLVWKIFNADYAK